LHYIQFIFTCEPSDFSELLFMNFVQWSSDGFEELTDTQFPLQGIKICPHENVI